MIVTFEKTKKKSINVTFKLFHQEQKYFTCSSTAKKNSTKGQKKSTNFVVGNGITPADVEVCGEE